MLQGIGFDMPTAENPGALTAAELESTVGITCTGGGRHAGRGTWNRIAWLADGSGFVAGELAEQAVSSVERGFRPGHPRARQHRFGRQRRARSDRDQGGQIGEIAVVPVAADRDSGCYLGIELAGIESPLLPRISAKHLFVKIATNTAQHYIF